MYKITKKQSLNNDVDILHIEAPLVALNAEPGHFVILRVEEDGERVPMTIAGTEGDDVVIIVQKLGYTTQLLGEKAVGDSIVDFVGPLGKAAHIHDVAHVVGVAGGVGAAPLLPQLKAYKEKGAKVEVVIGGRTKDFVILREQYEAFCDAVHITTDDGSLGLKGLVTDQLKVLLEDQPAIEHVVAIGPVIMMKYVTLMAKAYDKTVDVSLNPIMIDGTGMCGNCRVSIGGETRFACIDGPDFPGDDVDFDELMARQAYYEKEEHACHMRLKKK